MFPSVDEPLSLQTNQPTYQPAMSKPVDRSVDHSLIRKGRFRCDITPKHHMVWSLWQHKSCKSGTQIDQRLPTMHVYLLPAATGQICWQHTTIVPYYLLCNIKLTHLAPGSNAAKHGSVLPDVMRGTRRPSSSCCPSKHAIWEKLTKEPLAPAMVMVVRLLCGKGLTMPCGRHCFTTTDDSWCIGPWTATLAQLAPYLRWYVDPLVYLSILRLLWCALKSSLKYYYASLFYSLSATSFKQQIISWRLVGGT